MQMHHMTDTPTARDHVHTARVWAREALSELGTREWSLVHVESMQDAEWYHMVMAVAALFGPQGEMR